MFDKVAEVAGGEYVFKTVASHVESSDNDLKIDMAMYPTDGRARTAYELSSEEGDGHAARNAWAWMLEAVRAVIRYKYPNY